MRLNDLLEQGAAGPEVMDQLRELRQLAIDASDKLRQAIFALTGPKNNGPTWPTTCAPDWRSWNAPRDPGAPFHKRHPNPTV